MDEHDDRTESFEQPPRPVTLPKRSSRVPSLLAGVTIVATLAIAVGATALAAAPAPTDGQRVVPDASASADASARPERPKADRGEKLGRVGRIEVSSVNGNRIGLKTEDGWSRTIDVTADTTITRGGETATAADLKVGDIVNLRQRRNDDGTFTITRINVPSPRASGVVTAIDGNVVTIKGRRDVETKLTLTASTEFKLGRQDGVRADLAVGSVIAAQGALDGGSTFTATVIHIAPPVIHGVVKSTTASRIIVTLRDGTEATLHVTADTTYRVRGKGADAKLADIAVGAKIVATGKLRADGSMDATIVGAGKIKAPKPARSPAASATTG